MQKKREKLSKTLTFILRHKGQELGLKFTEDGFTKIDDLLNLAEMKKLGASYDDLKYEVDNNDKKRFQIKDDMIRATQGHSMNFEMNFKKIDDPDDVPIAVHGTYYKAWDTIKKEGLKPMSRTHIHFASGIPSDDGVISGMRNSSQLYIYLNVQKCLEDGIEICVSDNGVILTKGKDGVLSPEYFEKVIDAKTKTEIN